MKSKKKFIIFDLDGVICDFKNRWNLLGMKQLKSLI